MDSDLTHSAPVATEGADAPAAALPSCPAGVVAQPASGPPPGVTPDLCGVLTLALSSDGAHVEAHFQPALSAGGSAESAESAAAPPPTAEQVRARLKSAGWDGWWVDEPALGRWLLLVARATEPVTAVVAERKDGRCVVKVARDRMSATLTLVPPQGGVAPGLPEVRAELDRAGVKAGVLEPVLVDAVAAGEAAEREVAVGRPPVNGAHTQFELLIPNLGTRHPQLNTHGLIDYRDLGDLVVVREGTPLMRRIPPTGGEPGVDVLGNPLMAKPGVAKAFAPGLKGAETDRNDPDLLIARVTGQPVPVSQGVKVDPNFVIQHVDMSTGNVKFDGAVNIKGDVKEGMRVVSTGDVYVGGTVEAAEIEAGGNVVIKGGVIGRNEYNGRASGRDAWFNAKVTAQGSISARYAENAFLEAGGDVMLDDYAMHTEISALSHVAIGKPGTRKGRCMGGQVRATLSIRVAESGSAAGIHTVLQAGHNPHVAEQMEAIQQAQAKHIAEVASLQKIIDFVQLHPERDHDGLLARAAITQELHQGQLLELEQDRITLSAALTMASDAQVSVDVTVHGGTEVHLGGKIWTTADTLGSSVFRLNGDGEIVLGH